MCWQAKQAKHLREALVFLFMNFRIWFQTFYLPAKEVFVGNFGLFFLCSSVCTVSHLISFSWNPIELCEINYIATLWLSRTSNIGPKSEVKSWNEIQKFNRNTDSLLVSGFFASSVGTLLHSVEFLSI